MPNLPKIFKRKSSSNIKDAAKLQQEDTDSPPPVPQIPELVLTSTDSSSSKAIVPNGDQSSRPRVNRLNTSFSESSTTSGSRELLDVDSPNPPRTVSTPLSAPPQTPSPSFATIWKGIDDHDAQAGKNISKSEKIINKVGDLTSGAVNAAGSTSGVVGVIKTVITNEEVQAIGKGILDGIPAIMSALETLTEVHPFLKAAYLPFKLVYGLELKRRDNDMKRTTLFEKLKDAMMVLLELPTDGKNEQRLTPAGTPLLSRIEEICKNMNKDIGECYNVLNVQEKRSVAIKFLRASAWNEQLVDYVAKFETNRGDLRFALQLRTAAGVDEIRQSLDDIRAMFMQMLTSQEREIGQWIQQQGGEQAVFGSDEKMKALIKKESAISSAGHTHMATVINASLTETQLISSLKKEYHEDVKTAIRENMETFSNRFQMGVDQLRETLSAKISHEGDRIIDYISRGPHKRIKDKIVYEVWKDQGWRGSAKAGTLVLAIRDYISERVERVERGKVNADGGAPVSARPTPIDREESDDLEMAMGVPLPDSWVLEYLKPKRLRGVQQALDNDNSGRTTISEVNAFTRSRPTDWSLPKWIGYWSVGWQIFATKHCQEIEDIFNQMSLLTTEIFIKMPGNVPCVLKYMEGMWGHVTTLTSAIERFKTAPQWLQDHYQSYVNDKEAMFKKRLEQINYDIDSLETVNLVLGQEHIENVVFILLKLMLKRHLAKFHLCLKEEMDAIELDDDFDSILWVLEAAWCRYLNLVDIFKHEQASDLEQAFSWFSCGLFSKYWQYKEWTDVTYFRQNEVEGNYLNDDHIKQMNPEELKHTILIHSSDQLPATKKAQSESSTEKTPKADQPDETKKNLLFDITGRWYGFRWSQYTKPTSPMLCLDLVAEVPTVPDPPSAKPKKGKKKKAVEVKLTFTGETTDHANEPYGITGSITVKDNFPDQFSVELKQVKYYDGSSISYEGFLSPFKDMISGTVDGGDGQNFFFKRTANPMALSFRPLEAGTLSAKQLWHFAYDAVVNQRKRSHPDLKYIQERLTMVKWAVKLLTPTLHRNLSVTDEDSKQLAKTRLAFTTSEFREIYRLVQWYERVGNMQDGMQECNACKDTIVRSRIVCFDCEDTDNPENTVDFCYKRECYSSGPRNGYDKHQAKHVLFKCRAKFILKNWALSVWKARTGIKIAKAVYVAPPKKQEEAEHDEGLLAATAALEELGASGNGAEVAETKDADAEDGEVPTDEAAVDSDRTAFNESPEEKAIEDDAQSEESGSEEDSATGSEVDSEEEEEEEEDNDEDEEDVEEKLKCLCCHDRVLAPCWYCLDCPDQYAFVCDKCEDEIDSMLPWDLQQRYRTEAKNRFAHNVQHTLVRFGQDSEGEDNSNSHSDHSDYKPDWAEVEQRLMKKMDELVQQRFDKLESLLKVLLQPKAQGISSNI